MMYFKRFKGEGRSIIEVTKKQAKETLFGYYKDEFLDDVFDNNRAFRLETSFSEVWTMDDDGLTPIAGFYGVVG